MWFTLFLVGLLQILSIMAEEAQIFPLERGKSNQFALPQVPMVSIPMCFGFPGTPLWNSCWASFHQRMATFQQQMAAYQSAAHEATEKQLQQARKELHGASSMISLNGYKFRVKNLILSVKTVNGEISVDMAGVPPNLQIIKSPGSGLRWVGKNHDGIDAWFTIDVPSDIDVAAIRFTPSQYGIRVICPDASSSSFSSYHSVIVA